MFFSNYSKHNALLMFEPSLHINMHCLELEYFNYENVKPFKNKFFLM
jgi:hypothetical protein